MGVQLHCFLFLKYVFNKIILWRWEQFQPDLQGCVNGQFAPIWDRFLRPASVLAIAPLERCGKLDRWNAPLKQTVSKQITCNSICAGSKRNADFH